MNYANDLTTTMSDQQSDKGSTVPRFGEWDENDPASAEGYTHIFNNVRQERQSAAGNGPEYFQSPYRRSGEAPSSGSKVLSSNYHT